MQDDGRGLSGEDLERIFDPFFTTRRSGTGLGLAASMGAIRQQGGTIRVRSSEGEGACFEVLLPTVQPGWAAEPSDPSSEQARNLCVLVVGADPPLLRYVNRLLTGDGHRVRTFQEGISALRSLERDPDVDLLIVESELPDLDGAEVVRRTRARIGGCGVVMLAEYPRQLRGPSVVPDAAVVEKPFDADALFEAIDGLGLGPSHRPTLPYRERALARRKRSGGS